jgi:hypothetical protein
MLGMSIDQFIQPIEKVPIQVSPAFYKRHHYKLEVITPHIHDTTYWASERGAKETYQDFIKHTIGAKCVLTDTGSGRICKLVLGS